MDLRLVFRISALVVIISITLRKFVLRSLLSVSVSLFIICNRILNTFGCVFSISFSSSIVCGCLMIVLVSKSFWLKLTYFGGVLIRRLTVWRFIYSDILKRRSLMFKVFESCIVIFVFSISVGSVNRNELIGLCSWFKFVRVILMVLVSVLMVLFWSKISIFKRSSRFFRVLRLFWEIFFFGMRVIRVITDLIFVILTVFLRLFIGIRRARAFVSSIILMVLFGRWRSLMYFIVSFIVVRIVFAV